ncbi:ATP-binding protein [Streptomyces sp. NPDC054783]
MRRRPVPAARRCPARRRHPPSRPHPPLPRRPRHHLAAEPTAHRSGRHTAARPAPTCAWGADEDTVCDTQEIVSELVTNALRYGAPPVRLRVINDRTLTCKVQDRGISAPRLHHARSVDEGGRGLFICTQLAQNWGSAPPTTGRRSGPSKPSPHSTHGPLRRRVVHRGAQARPRLPCGSAEPWRGWQRLRVFSYRP